MKLIDKRYITLQIKNRLYKLNGSEFQSFFEDVMEMTFPDFQKIKLQGRFGDGGNDGYVKSSGTYYQVYSPYTPEVRETEATKKLKDDFFKLQKSWGSFQEIKRYVFVLNDKYHGSVEVLEKALEELKNQFPKISFDLCLADDFEKIITDLQEEDLISLGFSVDKRQAISIVEKSLNDIRDEIDRENSFLAGKYLSNISKIVTDLGEEVITLEYELSECEYLLLLEKPQDAVQKFESISKRYPKDPRSFLYLAEYYLNRKDTKRNQDLLQKAEEINPDFWLFSFLTLVRQNRLGTKFNRDQIDQIDVEHDPWIEATFYRLFAQLLEEFGDETGADEFIEKSIYKNTNRFSSYITRLSLWQGRLFKNSSIKNSEDISKKIIEEIKSIREIFSQNGEIRPRNELILNSIEINALFIQSDLSKIMVLIKESIESILSCSFDQQVDFFLVQFLQYVLIPNNDLFRLLDYIEQSDYEMSDILAEILFGQFLLNHSLESRGRNFYKKTGKKKMSDIIDLLENGEKEKFLKLIEDNERFSSILADTLKDDPVLRLEIIQSISPEKDILKNKHLLSYYIDQKDDDSAFSIIKNLDLTNLNSIQCLPILDVMNKKEAWDMQIMLLEKLIDQEKNDDQRFSFSMQLFNAYVNMKMYQKAINVGEILLKENQKNNYLSNESSISLLNNTIFACFERGAVDQKQFERAENLLEQYKPEKLPFEFRIGPEFELLLANANPAEALKVLIQAVEEKKLLTNEEYARLHFQLLKIDNEIGIGQKSLDQVEKNCFIKLSKNDQWYYLGDKDSLDAVAIDEQNKKYEVLNQKRLGSNIVFPDDYGPEIDLGVIECIFPIEKYIFWKSIKHFQELSQKGDLAGVYRIQIPESEDSIDPANLIKFFQDQRKKAQPIFDLYCQRKVPLAMLAMSEGGLINAIGRITQESQGFINCNDGSIDDLNRQKKLARSIIENELPFVIDSTSALFLVESGILQRIHQFIPNLVVPRSVINFLTEVASRFRYMPGQMGQMGFAKGKITISNIDKDKREQLKKDFISGITLLESNPENFRIISKANKGEGFTEKEIPDELCDACSIAKIESLPVLTEDPIFIRFNEIETNQPAPPSFSVWSLVRVLYEMGFLSFDDYLDFFSYLSFYRFWFLPISVEDIHKTIFGGEDIVTIQPTKIRYLNFGLTLSENYGVQLQLAYNLVIKFIVQILIDKAVTMEIAKEIFLEIINELPFNSSKRKLGLFMLNTCHSVISNINATILPSSDKKEIMLKIDYINKSIIFLHSEE